MKIKREILLLYAKVLCNCDPHLYKYTIYKYTMVLSVEVDPGISYFCHGMKFKEALMVGKKVGLKLTFSLCKLIC